MTIITPLHCRFSMLRGIFFQVEDLHCRCSVVKDSRCKMFKVDEGTKKKYLQLYIGKIRNNDKVCEVVTTIHRSTVLMILN